MIEVAVLFLGIFLTMIPALEILRTRGRRTGRAGALAVLLGDRALSSFLDNAPTYLIFLALGQGLRLADEVVGVPHAILAAISVGAVFMGANTYIGNAPNFMVKAIAEAVRRADAVVLRLHALQRGHPAACLRRRHLAVLPPVGVRL